ncbi:hypothetical protein AZG88_40495 [Rhodococcus sp. LB1]|nr:hypothetical protein AZG88_40495 [Rhodococcus sp. LB1]
MSKKQLSASGMWTSEALKADAPKAGALTSLLMIPYPLEQVADAQDRPQVPVGNVVVRVSRD